MKKASWIALAFACFFVFQTSQASAASPLDSKVEELLGTKYAWGGASTKGFDCSGFTMYVFAEFGIELPHWSKGQAAKGSEVKKDDLRPGDLVFFNTSGSGISHVGIYLGDGEFVHSASNKGVVINKLSEDYYKKRYVTARRILDDKAYETVTTDPEEETVAADSKE